MIQLSKITPRQFPKQKKEQNEHLINNLWNDKIAQNKKNTKRQRSHLLAK